MLKRAWHINAPLTTTTVMMVVALGVTVLGLLVDERLVTGAPVWLKPAKFAASFAIYSITLIAIFTLLPAWRRTRAIVGWVTAVVLLLEFAIIALQAGRGVASHFNVGTPLDTALFALMGLAIVIQTVASGALAVALFRQRFTDRALGWGLRFGTTISIIGAVAGGVMTQASGEQLDRLRAGEHLAVVGAHTVGGPDRGPGIPGTGWSTEHGDIRIGHFVGLHALQALPLVALGLARRRLDDDVRVRLVLTASASYSSLFALLLGQALRGQSVVAPDATTWLAAAAWAILTVAALALSVSATSGARMPLMRKVRLS
jgi:hypothetical protein